MYEDIEKGIGMSLSTLYLIGLWFGEDHSASITKTHVQNRLDYVFKHE